MNVATTCNERLNVQQRFILEVKFVLKIVINNFFLLLVYWLSSKWTYPKKSKSMVENLAWIRAQRPQKK